MNRFWITLKKFSLLQTWLTQEKQINEEQNDLFTCYCRYERYRRCRHVLLILTLEAMYWPKKCGSVTHARRKATAPAYRAFLQTSTLSVSRSWFLAAWLIRLPRHHLNPHECMLSSLVWTELSLCRQQLGDGRVWFGEFQHPSMEEEVAAAHSSTHQPVSR